MECIGIFGRWLGHKYYHVHNVEKGEIPKGIKMSNCGDSAQIVAVIESCRAVKTEYLFSECSRCGHRIHKP